MKSHSFIKKIKNDVKLQFYNRHRKLEGLFYILPTVLHKGQLSLGLYPISIEHVSFFFVNIM